MPKFLVIDDAEAEAITSVAKAIEDASNHKIVTKPVNRSNLMQAFTECLRIIYAGDPGITVQQLAEGWSFRVKVTDQAQRGWYFVRIQKERP